MKDQREYFEVNDTFIKTTVKRYMTPSVTALIGTTLTIVANSIIVGNYIGTDGLAALNVLNPIYFAFATLGGLIHVGASTNASVCIGKNDMERANSYATLAFCLSIVFSLLLTIGGFICFFQMVQMLGSTERIESYVVNYGVILLAGGSTVSFMYYPFNFLKADGRPKSGTYMFIVMFLLDLLFCSIFVWKLDMGIMGVALSFVLSTFLGDIYGGCLLYNKQAVFTFGEVKDVWKSTAEVIKTGSSMALNNLCNIFRTIVLNYIILNVMSEEGLTVFAVIGSVNSFSNGVISGIAQTITPLIGVFYGERDNISIKTVVREAVKKGTKGIVVMTLFISAFAKQIGAVFGVTEVPMLVPAIVMFAVSFLPGMFNNLYIFYYFTTEKIALSNILTVLRGFVIPILSAAYFVCCGTPEFIWLSFAVSEFVTFLVMSMAAWVKCRKNKNIKGLLLLDSRYEETDRYLAFSVKNEPLEASIAAEKISIFCKEKKMSSKTAMAICLAVEEMLLIIFEHCLLDTGKQYADVRIVRMGEKIILYMRCAGELFDPIAYYRKRKIEAGDEVLTDDSLGIEMIVKQAADVMFSRTFGMNNLTIIIYERSE